MKYFAAIIFLFSFNSWAISTSSCYVEIQRISEDAVNIPGLGLNSQIYMVENPSIPSEKQISVRDCFYSSLQFVSAYSHKANLRLEVTKSTFFGLWSSTTTQNIVLRTVAKWKHTSSIDGKVTQVVGHVSNNTTVNDELSVSDDSMISGNHALDLQGLKINLSSERTYFELTDNSVLTELD